MPIARAKQIENETGKGKSNRMEEVDRETLERVWFEVWANIVWSFLESGKVENDGEFGRQSEARLIVSEWWMMKYLGKDRREERKEKKGPKEAK